VLARRTPTTRRGSRHDVTAPDVQGDNWSTPPRPSSGIVFLDGNTQRGMLRATAICALLLGVAITALVWRHGVSPHEVGMQPLPVPPRAHLPGPSVMIPDAKPSKRRSVSTGHHTSGRVNIGLPSVAPDSKPMTVSPHNPAPTHRTKPPAGRIPPRKPKTPPKTSPGTPAPTPITTPVATPGPTASPAPSTREPAASVPPTTTTPTPPVAPPPPPVTTPPVDSRPGHGYGDDNHEHTGPPGQSKDGGGHDDSNDDVNHGHSNKHGGGSGDDGSD
jgi:hypothetical protein